MTDIQEIKARLDRAHARIEQGLYVAAVELATDELGDLVEAWDLLAKIVQQDLSEAPWASHEHWPGLSECLLCDARDLIEGRLGPNHTPRTRASL